MNGAAGHAATRRQRAFVGVQAGERRQDGRVDVHQAAFVTGAKFGGKDAHETGEDDQIGLVSIDFFHHGLIEGAAGGEIFVVQAVGRDAALRSPCQTGGGCAVAQDGGDADIRNTGVDDGLHVAAAAGNQNNDVFHGRTNFGLTV